MLEYIYENKTAALLEAPLMIGAVLGGANPDEIRRMEIVGSRLGAAFQIRDDILDVTSTEEVLGKPVQSDLTNEKQTFVSLAGGVQEAEKLVRRLTDEAVGLLEEVPGDTAFMKQLIQKMALRSS